MVNIFGVNLSTVSFILKRTTLHLLITREQTDGEQWQRHRKITASCFNEQNNELVWSESLCQAQGMIQYWASKKSTRSIADDTRTFSLHVLSSAGFGKSYPFQGLRDPSAANLAINYKESLQTILDNCILLMVLGQRFLSKKWLPSRLRKLHQATVTFKGYMTEVYEEEKASMAKGKRGGRNLMTSLVRASTDVTGTLVSSNQTSIYDQSGLTESEIYGNMFVFNFAGHDTTAHTLAFAIVILSAHPSVQEWLSEELQYVLGDSKSENWSYTEVFPRLKRCLAVLVSFDTLCDFSSWSAH